MVAIVKYSGESFLGSLSSGIEFESCTRIVEECAKLHRERPIALVVGGGNIFRGILGVQKGLHRVQADYVGMLATIMNGIAIADMFSHHDIDARVMSAIPIDRMVERYARSTVLQHIEHHRLPIFVAGTGNPFFTVDTSLILRAAELGQDSVYLGLNQHIESDISWNTALEKDFIEPGALALSREQGITIYLFDANKSGSLTSAIEDQSYRIVV